MNYNYFLTLFFLFGLINQVNAQQNRILVQPTIGVVLPVLASGSGFHIGVNPSVRIDKGISVEGQISYMYTKISSSFISGRAFSLYSINALVGGRLYLNPEGSNTRFFVNLLYGLNYSIEKSSNEPEINKYTRGYSYGAFLESKRIVFGLSVDTHPYLVLKIGYSF